MTSIRKRFRQSYNKIMDNKEQITDATISCTQLKDKVQEQFMASFWEKSKGREEILNFCQFNDIIFQF